MHRNPNKPEDRLLNTGSGSPSGETKDRVRITTCWKWDSGDLASRLAQRAPGPDSQGLSAPLGGELGTHRDQGQLLSLEEVLPTTFYLWSAQERRDSEL